VKRRIKTKNFLPFKFFDLWRGGVGGAVNKNDRKFLGFAPREQGASVIRQNPADFVRNTF
jgi:hypothetical protein